MTSKQYFVYPGHGVGVLIKRETRNILGSNQVFLSLEILDSGMKILVPEKSKDTLGLRSVMDKQTARKVKGILENPTPHALTEHGTWATTYRKYMDLIRLGEPLGMAQAYANLRAKRDSGDLSFGERKMLDNCFSLLVREVDVVLGRDAALKIVQGGGS